MVRTSFDRKRLNPHTKRIVVLMLTLVLAGQIPTAAATPVAPVRLVNHTLKQCIDRVILADECRSCTPVAGWEVLPAGQCPAEYKSLSLHADKELPVSCVEYPRNDWAACTWGRYPSVTPVSTVVTGAPRSILSVTPSTPKFAAVPVTPAITCYSFDAIFLAGIGGGILGMIVTGIVFMLSRRSQILKR